VSVALLGPNGVGKSTLASGLQRRFPFGSSVVYMGLWKGAGGGRTRRVSEVLARPLRIWSRYAAARYQQARGRLVIYDRYVYEARLPARPPLLAAKRLYSWLLEHAVPRPDAAVVLDVDGRVAYGRKQENPPEDLESERQVYALLAASESEVELVDAARDPGAVRADVTEIVWRKLATRWRGRGATCGPESG
jgi:thymidylate kinase